jgi:hypothetical protein
MLRRTPLKTKTPLRSKSTLKAKKPMKRKPARKAPKADDKNRFAAIHAINNGYWCAVGECGWADECGGTTTVSHRPGAGTALKSSHDQIAGICTNHHLQGPNSIEKMGIKDWVKKYGPHEDYEKLTAAEIKGESL